MISVDSVADAAERDDGDVAGAHVAQMRAGVGAHDKEVAAPAKGKLREQAPRNTSSPPEHVHLNFGNWCPCNSRERVEGARVGPAWFDDILDLIIWHVNGDDADLGERQRLIVGGEVLDSGIRAVVDDEPQVKRARENQVRALLSLEETPQSASGDEVKPLATKLKPKALHQRMPGCFS